MECESGVLSAWCVSQGERYVRGSMLVPASPSIVASVMTQSSLRVLWDPHFGLATTVEEVGPDTLIIKLQGCVCSRRFSNRPRSVSSNAVVRVLLLVFMVGFCWSQTYLFWVLLFCGLLLWPLLEKPMGQKNLILLQHREQAEAGVQWIMETSCESIRAEVSKSCTLGRVNVGGYVLEPVSDEGWPATRVTMVANMDFGTY